MVEVTLGDQRGDAAYFVEASDLPPREEDGIGHSSDHAEGAAGNQNVEKRASNIEQIGDVTRNNQELTIWPARGKTSLIGQANGDAARFLSALMVI